MGPTRKRELKSVNQPSCIPPERQNVAECVEDGERVNNPQLQINQALKVSRRLRSKPTRIPTMRAEAKQAIKQYMRFSQLRLRHEQGFSASPTVLSCSKRGILRLS